MCAACAHVRCMCAACALHLCCMCDHVVEALRICYIDFKPLRVAGDLIFKVIGEVVERRAKARTSDPEIPETEAS